MGFTRVRLLLLAVLYFQLLLLLPCLGLPFQNMPSGMYQQRKQPATTTTGALTGKISIVSRRSGGGGGGRGGGYGGARGGGARGGGGRGYRTVIPVHGAGAMPHHQNNRGHGSNNASIGYVGPNCWILALLSSIFLQHFA